jgi:siroheme synthase
VTHRGVSTGFLVVAGHSGEALTRAVGGVRPHAVTVIVMMGLAARDAIVATLTSCGWATTTPAAIVCGASTPDEWIWTGTLEEMGAVPVPAGIAGVLVIGDVVDVREALAVSARPEVMYGGS